MNVQGSFVLLPLLLLGGACSLPSTPSQDGTSGSGGTEVSTTPFGQTDTLTWQYKTNDTAYRGTTQILVSDPTTVANRYPLSATFTKAYGAANGGYGLVFERTSANDFWFADIDVNGTYAVGQVKSGSISYLTASGTSVWVASSSLAKGYGAANTVTLAFDGANVYTLSLNGTPAMTFTDAAATSASDGFNVGILSTENFPEVPVDVSMRLVTPSGLSWPAVPSSSLSRSLGAQE